MQLQSLKPLCDNGYHGWVLLNKSLQNQHNNYNYVNHILLIKKTSIVSIIALLAGVVCRPHIPIFGAQKFFFVWSMSYTHTYCFKHGKYLVKIMYVHIKL